MVTIGRRWCVSSWALGAVLVGLSLAFVPVVSAQLMEPAATDEELAEAEARALFNAAVAAYDAGRYEDALESFERAYRRSNRAALLYNMGQCYDRLRRDEEAVNAFERYLEAMPAAENRAQVESRIRALREAIARRANPELAPTAVAAAAEPARRRSRGRPPGRALPPPSPHRAHHHQRGGGGRRRGAHRALGRWWGQRLRQLRRGDRLRAAGGRPMTGQVRALALSCLVALSASAAGCADKVTQVVVSIDAESSWRNDTTSVRVVVRGGAAGDAGLENPSRDVTLMVGAGESYTFPIDVTVAPLNGDVSRRWAVDATGGQHGEQRHRHGARARQLRVWSHPASGPGVREHLRRHHV
jgi:hypothetical protein